MYFKNSQNRRSIIKLPETSDSDSRLLKQALESLNESSSEYGLILTSKEINRLSDAVRRALIESDRVEIGSGIMPVLASEFRSSVFVTRENYASVLEHLILIFFKVKTAMCDGINDRDLVRLMKDYYENKSFGGAELSDEDDIEKIIKYIETEKKSYKGQDKDVYDTYGYTDERN